MKISVLFTEGGRQIMMTPETEHEKKALKMIGPDDELKVVAKWGRFGGERETIGFEVGMNQSGFYRTWEHQDSLMFVIEDKPETKGERQ